MLRSLRFLAAITLIGLVVGCSTRPYVVTPAKKVVRSLDALYEGDDADATSIRDLGPRPRLVGLCYNASVNSYEEVSAEAAYQCGGPVELRERDWLWTPCSLLQPQRATFTCLPPPPSD